MGRAIRECKLDRNELFVTTKLYPEDLGYDRALKAFEKSCKQLQVAYVDLYLIHFPGLPTVGSKPAADLETARKLRVDSWLALEKLYREGKCKSIGVSNFEQRHLDELLANSNVSCSPMVNQCEFHPYFNNKDLFEFCKEKHIQFEVRFKNKYQCQSPPVFHELIVHKSL